MNRTLIIVKEKAGMFRSVRMHWSKGETVEAWIRSKYDGEDGAKRLIAEGHRSDLYTPHFHSGPDGEPWTHRTLREATAHCEHLTLCYWNGKRWAFTHHTP